MTSWTDHVKAYQQHHGCSYKQALSGASASYQPASSGAGLKSLARKAKNTTKRGMKLADTAMPYAQQAAQMANIQVPGELAAAYGLAKQVNGGNLRSTMRKAKHTAQRVKKVSNKVMKVADVAMPYVEMAGLTVAPELVAAYEGAKLIQKATGGSFKAHGGSFKTHGGCMGGQSCKSCGGSVHARSSSSMVHPAHHSFAPMKPKSFRELQMVN